MKKIYLSVFLVLKTKFNPNQRKMSDWRHFEYKELQK